MTCYELNFTVPSPGFSTSFMEFSPNGRFLGVGDQGVPSLYILDKLAGFHPRISAITLREPTALVWETTETFYVGFINGYFAHYQINLKGEKLVEGVVNSSLHGEGFPITSMALDAQSRTLVMSVGPGVFAFHRIHATSKFYFVARISTRFNFKKDPGTPAPPFPRSMCFAPNNMLVITFCGRYMASIVLTFIGVSRLSTSFHTAQIDHSGLPLLEVIISANEEEIHQFTRVWVYGNASETGDGAFPFLFINGGAATLSGSSLGAAIIRDTITHHETQLLEHTVTVGHAISAMAYHVSNEAYTIATADRGTGSTIKIWTARRPSLRSQTRHCSLMTQGWAVATSAIALVVVVLIKIGVLPDINEVSQIFVQSALTFTKLCIKIGYLTLGVAEGVVLNLGGALD